jgi:hypothetical protein
MPLQYVVRAEGETGGLYGGPRVFVMLVENFAWYPI